MFFITSFNPIQTHTVTFDKVIVFYDKRNFLLANTIDSDKIKIYNISMLLFYK